MTLVQVDSNICSLSNNTDKEYVAHAGASPDTYSQYKKILRFIIFFVDTQYIYFSSVSPYPSFLFLSFNNNYPSQAPLSPWGQRTDRNLKKRLNDAKKGNQATFLTPPLVLPNPLVFLVTHKNVKDTVFLVKNDS